MAIPQEDMFSIYDGLAKEQLKPEINMNLNNLKSIKVPNHFKRDIYTNISADKKLYTPKINQISKYITNKARQYGFEDTIHTAIFEAILNAHQHGNNLNETKQILVGSFINEKNLEIIIADQGNFLHENFHGYIHAQRENKNNKNNFLNWYEFSNDSKLTSSNLGTGTSFMHLYMDEVKYFKSKDIGGLAVYMKKYNN